MESSLAVQRNLVMQMVDHYKKSGEHSDYHGMVLLPYNLSKSDMDRLAGCLVRYWKVCLRKKSVFDMVMRENGWGTVFKTDTGAKFELVRHQSVFNYAGLEVAGVFVEASTLSRRKDTRGCDCPVSYLMSRMRNRTDTVRSIMVIN